MCLYPKLIINRKYTANKKNGGNIPPLPDPRVKYVPIGCQECIECRKQKARSWQARLLEDIRENKNGKFITLTFSNESIKKIYEEIEDGLIEDIDNRIATYAVRHFLERWRKEYKKSLRHWLVTELGHNGTENIHIHGIVWTDEPLTKVEKHWQYGFVWKGKEQNGQIINYVNEKTINYIVKYIHKQDERHTTFKSKILTSSAIGANYLKRQDHHKNTFQGRNTNETYRTRTGHKINLPIYWRNKIYSEQEREKLWLNRLDKQERWVRGERIDISKGEQTYLKVLKWHQEINKQLGYGDGTKSWDKEQYERQRRIMMNEKRIKNANKNNK